MSENIREITCAYFKLRFQKRFCLNVLLLLWSSQLGKSSAQCTKKRNFFLHFFVANNKLDILLYYSFLILGWSIFNVLKSFKTLIVIPPLCFLLTAQQKLLEHLLSCDFIQYLVCFLYRFYCCKHRKTQWCHKKYRSSSWQSIFLEDLYVPYDRVAS